MRKGPARNLLAYRCLLATSLATGLASLLFFTGLGNGIEWKSFDLRARIMAGPAPSTSGIILILVDQNSLDWARENSQLPWPWPREIWAHILDFCHSRGVRAVGMDILFTEPSFYGEYDDAALALAAQRFGPVAGAMFLGHTTGTTTSYPPDLPQPPLLQGKEPPARTRASMAHGNLAASWRIPGNVGLNPDADGVYRNMRAFTSFDGRAFPSLGLATWLAAHPEVSIVYGEKRIIIDQRTIPLNHNHETRLRFRGPSRTHTAIPAGAILRSAILEMQGHDADLPEADRLKDAYVLIGYSAPGLHDLAPVPLDGAYPGVEVHATFLDNFLSNDFLDDMKTLPFLSLVIILSAAASLLVLAVPATAMAATALTLSFALPVVISLALYAVGSILPLTPLMAGMLMAVTASIFINYTTEGQQKRFIKNAFSQYLSPAVIDELLLNPGKLRLGGEKKEISIFFSDLEGFTTLSEGMDPESLTSFLNHYLSAMTDIILESGGTVDKYEGDAIIAFWNAPLAIHDHAERAVRAALCCQDCLEAMATDLRQWTERPVRMRIGINTGPAVVGNLGSSKRFDYTMLGDSVNLAARLEGVNKVFGTRILIAESTAAHLSSHIRLREIARVQVVGKERSIRIFEPAWAELPSGDFATFGRGLDAFYTGNLTEAINFFGLIASTDPPARAYMEKIKQISADPATPWSGLWILDQK
ncbi:adenylate/guanylate cyclase domain-containing protein [Desulfobotulus sp. H1]|uniref:Adenylate/guanylate cyclase domain-containing protein n=1 Tax=Desulfobotulus pelophilus TaxID=2823377 RepID=A0ABT3N771_9BACT|nr:adenylate/guanylate cyclase domain-containing protein [Desulfobotulus pelophilus]MCW7753309.1 adenylate/guanylate cyclase domain-containing protein [Desulfobotulus pelophilus]